LGGGGRLALLSYYTKHARRRAGSSGPLEFTQISGPELVKSRGVERYPLRVLVNVVKSCLSSQHAIIDCVCLMLPEALLRALFTKTCPLTKFATLPRSRHDFPVGAPEAAGAQLGARKGKLAPPCSLFLA